GKESNSFALPVCHSGARHRARPFSVPYCYKPAMNPIRIAIPLAVVLGLFSFAWFLDAQGGASRDLAFALLTGAAFGVVLQRARFCFLCNFRDLVQERDPRGALSILAALAAGIVGYTIIF